MATEWYYYNHALLPKCAPHENPDISNLCNKKLWSFNGQKPLLARWTTDFDSKTITNWWYVICDSPFDSSKLNAKKRNVINNGRKYCHCFICDPFLYENELFTIYNESQKTYPKKNQTLLDNSRFHEYLKTIVNDDKSFLILCTLKETNVAVGYSVVRLHETYSELISQKSLPLYEKFQVNAALVTFILELFREKFNGNFYVCDGARNINHVTHFQDYLEKYFFFRKAYCKLHIQYRSGIGFLVKLLFPFRRLLSIFSGSKFLHNINGVLTMEQLVRANND